MDWIKLVQDYTMHFELYYSKTTDWCCDIWKKGCGEHGEDIVICNEQGPDVNDVLAAAEEKLMNWLKVE